MKTARFWLLVGGLLAVGGALTVVIVAVLSQPSGNSRKGQELQMVKILTPPPPPPPQPKLPEPPPEQKMIEQDPVANDEPKPDNTPKEAAPAGLATGIKGDGTADGFGLGGGGTGGGGRIGGTNRPASRWGWYAARVQTAVGEALRQDPKARLAAYRIEIRLWADGGGRVTRAGLRGTTGDPSLDEEIKSRVLTGMVLPEPPPQGMPMPIVLRISAVRPT